MPVPNNLNPARYWIGLTVYKVLNFPGLLIALPFVLLEMLADWYAFTAARWLQNIVGPGCAWWHTCALAVGNWIAGYKPNHPQQNS